MTRRKTMAQEIEGDTVAIYVISKGDVEVKIGLSKNVGNRSLGLQTSNSAELNVYWATRLERADGYRLEAHIHKQLKPTINHIRGEWYAMAPETAVHIVKGAIKELGLKNIVDIRFGFGEAA